VSNLQQTHLNRARASLRQALSWYGNIRKDGEAKSNQDLVELVKPELEILRNNLTKLESYTIKIAVFGLVSRGKSAVLNALLGKKVLETGPLNGVTKFPKSVSWVASDKVKVELIDTPGLDEIEGQAREIMARDVARQADLILFVVSGDITKTEYQALLDLRLSQKPIILVFNKIDLYPDTDKSTIYNNLQRLGAGYSHTLPLQPDEIVMIAAEPAALEVAVEGSDGAVNYEWETQSPVIDELKQTILKILNREGRSLLALNALIQAREAEEKIAQKTIDKRNLAAEELIWQYTKYKALVVGLNPVVILDVVGGAVLDLLLIRSLSKLYGLPMTSYQAGKVLKTILFSSGGLILAEVGSSFMLGLGKTTAAVTSGDSPFNITAFAGTAVTQGGVAAYGTYTIGKVTQSYLEKGCTWGQLGVSTVIQEILSQVPQDTILFRLRQELGR
jgi:hypothetical protein